MILAGFYSGHLKHSCSERVSGVWGCYAPVKKARWNLPCWICFGEKGFEECPVCEGYGAVGMTRCPNSSNTGTLNKLYYSYGNLNNLGVLPVAGGMLDQSAAFVSFVEKFPAFLHAWEVTESAKKDMLKELKRDAKT